MLLGIREIEKYFGRGRKRLSSHIATLYGVAIASVIFPFSGYLETATSVLCYGVPEWGRPDVPHTRQGAF